MFSRYGSLIAIRTNQSKWTYVISSLHHMPAPVNSTFSLKQVLNTSPSYYNFISNSCMTYRHFNFSSLCLSTAASHKASPLLIEEVRSYVASLSDKDRENLTRVLNEYMEAIQEPGKQGDQLHNVILLLINVNLLTYW